MGALIEYIAPGTPLGQLANSLLGDTVSREGGKAFTKELVSSALEAVLSSRALKTPKTPTALLGDVDPASKLTDMHNATAAADVIVKVVRKLEEQTTVTFSDIVGQLLWRNREAEPLRRAPHEQVAEDLTWVAGPAASASIVDMAAAVFREVTLEDGGRMKWRSWLKVAELIWRDPLLSSRLHRSDVDRVFHAEAMRAVRLSLSSHEDQTGQSIGLSECLGLLVQLADIAKVHPFLVFFAVGVHAEYLPVARRGSAVRQDSRRRSGASSGAAAAAAAIAAGTSSRAGGC